MRVIVIERGRKSASSVSLLYKIGEQIERESPIRAL